MTGLKEKLSLALFFLIFILLLHGGGSAVSDTADSSLKGIPPNRVADYLQAVIESDRKVYTTRIVERMQNQGIVLAAEDWEARHALPLPAQF
ncbi:MAG: hypothetical protein JSU59_04835, partial [Nitrospirota bacterium]